MFEQAPAFKMNMPPSGSILGFLIMTDHEYGHTESVAKIIKNRKDIGLRAWIQ